ncbi:cobalamin adenosyltransferase [Cellulosilyticum lentocellum]|uniref:Cobalamin adenosyltransferase n=1 Tax=Cellulosilyticum lentocellum (strain ATCC 49066 / DSM 5427 / NCIMB 11756 / RHM5) TaxID=642492 RepID=F2JLY2_CELLD|nr:cobalamin adenosyltransferase [Cellulosilyticum lentocellum]ADZ85762.1 cobalamin adenosyltransferase [Cellulosilyticum lentocellum DSM 5427]
MSVLTENDVRQMLASGQLKEKGQIVVPRNKIITPSARAYLLEKGIEMKIEDNLIGEVTKVSEEQMASDRTEVYETMFGAKLNEKPEHMTHLRDNLLVFKDHPRIVFRGAIDSLEAEIVMTQIFAEKEHLPQIIADLEEIIKFIRRLLRNEVCGEPIGEFTLQGLDAKELREHSHHPSKYYGIKHFLPHYKQGEMVAYLNKLRTLTRQTELIAYKAFKDEYGQVSREDIIKSLNRLSSLFWVMMFKYLAGKYKANV